MSQTLTQTILSPPTPPTESSKVQISGQECGPYGQRLCVQVADELAARTPDRIYATVTISPSSIEHGFRDITIKQFTNAVNYAAWEVERLFGKNEEGFPVIAYIGVSDVRYAIHLYAAIKTGYQVSKTSRVPFYDQILEDTY